MLYVDLVDETGGIATVATILACNQINLKNIGIVNNREFEEAVLRIEFYEEAPCKKAAALSCNSFVTRPGIEPGFTA